MPRRDPACALGQTQPALAPQYTDKFLYQMLLGGYVATPTGLAALAPAPRDAPSPALTPVAPPGSRSRARVLPRPLPRRNKISPNDLW